MFEIQLEKNSDLGNYITKSSLLSSMVTDPNLVNAPLALLNGWSSQLQNAPDAIKQHWGILITVWEAYSETGNLTKNRAQLLTYNATIQVRYYSASTGKWSSWGAS